MVLEMTTERVDNYHVMFSRLVLLSSSRLYASGRPEERSLTDVRRTRAHSEETCLGPARRRADFFLGSVS